VGAGLVRAGCGQRPGRDQVPGGAGFRGLLSGTKTWSSRAAFADRAFGLFRSDPAAERHRGLTYLMFDLRAPGVTVRPIRQLGGRTGFAEIFLDEEFVPDADVIGEPGDGWRIAMSTASHERGLSLRSPGRFLAAARALAGGGALGAEASLGKVFWSELDVALHETALDLLGPLAEDRDGPDARWLEDYLFALAGPIYAGTNEIQRTLIAERVLGLPR
jgi:alkylation response protein AidB-like acyl-CoA dehydrogenase